MPDPAIGLHELNEGSHFLVAQDLSDGGVERGPPTARSPVILSAERRTHVSVPGVFSIALSNETCGEDRDKYKGHPPDALAPMPKADNRGLDCDP